MADSKDIAIDHVEASHDGSTAVIDTSGRLQAFLARQHSLTRIEAIKEHKKAIAWYTILPLQSDQ